MKELEISQNVKKAAEEAMHDVSVQFEHIADLTMKNTGKVLAAFRNHKVAETMFAGSTGYAYDDRGRQVLEEIYADVFDAESALVRIGFVNGTHAVGCAIIAGLQEGDTLLSITGNVYDTLQTLTNSNGLPAVKGSLASYGIKFKIVDLKDGMPDVEAIKEAVTNDKTIKKVFIQRSKGYTDRKTLSCAEIGELVSLVKGINSDIKVMVDNCYGEFTEEHEPCYYGADLIAGSLIKNAGGSLAPTGGYIAGCAELVEDAATRYTIPGIGGECGATLGVNRLLFQGFFMAPHVVGEALKTAIFAAALLQRLGFDVYPKYNERRNDIIQLIKFGEPQKVINFCKGLQAASPVDSFLSPEPWDMPGYDDKVIMAAGAFVQGASIELSCDAPMREPYIAYLQGGITFESGKFGIMYAAQAALSDEAL